MGTLEKFGLRRYLREGVDAPVPDGGIKKYLFLLTTHFWKLVGVNLLFLAFSLPVITLPAALCALNRVCVKLIRDGNCFVWQEFVEEFKSSLWRAMPLGLLFGGALFVAYYLLSLGASNAQNVYGMFFSGVGLFIAAIALLLGCWTFVLVAMQPLKNGDILRNARILALLEGKRDLGILGVLFAGIFVMLWLFPLSLGLAALLLIALLQFTLCFLVNTAVEERIIKPHNKFQTSDKSLV